MPITTAYSSQPLPEAVSDLKQQCTRNPRVVLYFASSDYHPASLASLMWSAFPNAVVAGCSTAGELAGGRMLTGSVVAAFLDGSLVTDAACAVVENLRSEMTVDSAFASLEEHYGAPASMLDHSSHIGLVLADGLSGAEERLIDEIGNRTDVFFVGGSAGDDLKFKSTHIFANGRAYTDAAALLLLRVPGGFDILKTQSFRSAGRTLTATKVDEAARKVVEFDHKPALDAYAEALGVGPGQADGQFFEHPLGLMVDGEPFVRSPQRVEDRAIVFYCQIKEGMELELLQATDIVADTRQAVEASKAAGAVRGLLDFQCILRALQLRNEKRCDEYGAIFAGIPMAGFSTYGEAYLGHINQTSTMLLFR